MYLPVTNYQLYRMYHDLDRVPAVNGSYVTYANARAMLRYNPTTLQGFDPHGKVEWMATPTGTGEWNIVVIDGPRSLRAKIAAIHQKGVPGIGFWTLDQATYNNPDSELNDVLKEKRGTLQSRKIESIASMSLYDQRWHNEAQREEIGTGEVAVAIILSTLRNATSPVAIGKIFKNTGIRTQQGLFVRSEGGNDVLTWLAREQELLVTKIWDGYHPYDRYKTLSDRSEPFDYEHAIWQLELGSLILASGKPNWLDRDIVFVIKGVNRELDAMTIIDPLDGQEKTIPQNALTLYYAYAVR